MIKNYIFDLYGTLADIHTNETKHSLYEKMALFYSEHGAPYVAKEWRQEYRKSCNAEKEAIAAKRPDVLPDINLYHVFAALFHKKGAEVSETLPREAVHLFRILSIQYVHTYKGIPELLQTLKKSGKKIYLLSNAQGDFARPELCAMNLLQYFDGICISSEEEAVKPDYYFYDTLFQRYGLKKEESVMIGNDPVTDIEGAISYGIQAVYIHSNLSPEITEPLLTKLTVMDGSIEKLVQLLHCNFEKATV